ncbi:MAG: zinc-binding dehydrogenase [bacterium]
MSQKVKAAVMVNPGRIEIREFPMPELDEGSMLVRVEMCGICGTDKHTYRGEVRQHAGTPAEKSIPFPIIPGHEIVGRIDRMNCKERKVDFDGNELRPGDLITICPDIVCGRCYWCRHPSGFPLCENIRSIGTLISCEEPPHLFGGWAEYIYISPDVFVFKVPDGLPVESAVLTELMAVTYNLDKIRQFSSLDSEGFFFGCSVVIQGVGPMGICHLIKARMLGAGEIIAIDKSDFRLNLAKEFGASSVININNTTKEERLEKIREITKGLGADIVVECAGLPEAIPEGLEILRRGGTYIEAGNFVDAGSVEINPHRHLCAKNVRLIGLTGHPPTGYKPSMDMMLRYGDVYPFGKIVTHRFNLEEAGEAILFSENPDTMKVVIAP